MAQHIEELTSEQLGWEDHGITDEGFAWMGEADRLIDPVLMAIARTIGRPMTEDEQADLLTEWGRIVFPVLLDREVSA